MPLEKIKQANFEAKVLASKIPVMVVFYAPWSNLCRLMTPSLEALALENTERVVFYRVATDENPALIKKYGIRDLPAFLFFKNGNLELFEKGQKSKLKLQSLLDILLLSE